MSATPLGNGAEVRMLKVALILSGIIVMVLAWFILRPARMATAPVSGDAPS